MFTENSHSHATLFPPSKKQKRSSSTEEIPHSRGVVTRSQAGLEVKRKTMLREFHFTIANYQSPQVYIFYAREELDVYWHLLHSVTKMIEIEGCQEKGANEMQRTWNYSKTAFRDLFTSEQIQIIDNGDAGALQNTLTAPQIKGLCVWLYTAGQGYQEGLPVDRWQTRVLKDVTDMKQVTIIPPRPQTYLNGRIIKSQP